MIPTNETALKKFLELPYEKLEVLNLAARKKRDTLAASEQEKEYRAYLQEENGINTIIICFSDIEGKLHMLDYDKKFLLNSTDNLTFDGSSIRGFTAQFESDLRLAVDWTSFYWLPSDVFGAGKILMFANVLGRNREPYVSDFRGLLQNYSTTLRDKKNITGYAAAEIEGFLLQGIHAEQTFCEEEGLQPVSKGGYFQSLPLDVLRQFIDKVADAQRAMGFQNEKNHPEVAPSQFEINFSYTDVLRAADEIQLYKLICRQIAQNMGYTASFLPKPLMHMNGNGMHTNFSLSQKGKNMFYEPKGIDNISQVGHDFIERILHHATDICLIFNASVNAYRRLDPHFEAPNEIKVSGRDRGSMIRLPVGNEKTTRIEVRSVAPDANPYLVLFTIMKTGLEGEQHEKNSKQTERFLPSTITEALAAFETSNFVTKLLGEENKQKYLMFKQNAANRSPKELGTWIKKPEIVFHHEVTNQLLWNTF